MQREEREKKVGTEMNIITNAHATVTVHICTVTVAIVHKMHNYAQADVDGFFAQMVEK